MFLVLLFVVGAAMGSFACCQARRMRRTEKGEKKLGKRSVCLSCKKTLKWYENLPIVSWVLQKGKCRKCGAKIGKTEILAEFLTGVVFLAIGAYFAGFLRSKCGMMNFQCEAFVFALKMSEWGVEIWIDIAMLVILLAVVTVLAIIFIYDALWQKMPTKVLWTAVGLAGVHFALRCVSICMYTATDFAEIWNYYLGPELLSAAFGVVILAGVYFALYFFSKEQLVGSGDWILSLAVSLLIGDWFLALTILFLSNFLASVVMAPQVMGKNRKKRMNSKVPFGPFLIVAFIVVYLIQDALKMMFYFNTLV